MKKFAFELEPLLAQRKHLEDAKRQTLAQQQHAHTEAKRELDRLKSEFQAHARELRDLRPGFDVVELRLRYAHLQFLDQSIGIQAGLLSDLEDGLNRACRDLLAVGTKRKVVDTLKQRRRAGFVARRARLDEKEIDEVNARLQQRFAPQARRSS